MHKIIKGKIYSTATAKEVASSDSGYNWGDSYCIHETLYRKRTGEFFLYGCGGAMTEYGAFKHGHWIGSERIIPLTLREAKIWVTAFCDADTYIALFGKKED